MKLHQKISVWCLIALLFTQTIGFNALFFLYTIDRDVFVELFCENQDKPELYCEGVCMLTKLDDQASQNTDLAVLLELTQFQLYFTLGNAGFYQIQTPTLTVLYPRFVEHLPLAPLPDNLLKPPIFLV